MTAELVLGWLGCLLSPLSWKYLSFANPGSGREEVGMHEDLAIDTIVRIRTIRSSSRRFSQEIHSEIGGLLSAYPQTSLSLTSRVGGVS